MKLVTVPISFAELASLAKSRFGDMVKAVVDVEKGIMALDADLHADEEAYLLKEGSKQSNLWGINLYPEVSGDDWIQFDSMINVRPSVGNRSRGVSDSTIQTKIIAIVTKLIIR